MTNEFLIHFGDFKRVKIKWNFGRGKLIQLFHFIITAKNNSSVYSDEKTILKLTEEHVEDV
jgi:hypothetical protein